MHSERVFVRSVRGRFPHRAGKLEGKHVASLVSQEGDRVRIRLDHEEFSDFWLELEIRIEEVQS